MTADVLDTSGKEWYLICCQRGHPLQLLTRTPGTDEHELSDLRAYCVACQEGWKIDADCYAHPLAFSGKEAL